MRLACVLLSFVLLIAAKCPCRAVELIQQVPAGSAAYAQLALLAKVGMLSSGQDALRPNAANRLLTRFDFGVQLVEPLRRFIALVEATDAPNVDPVQRMRQELAYNAVKTLSAGDFDKVLLATAQLLTTYSDIVGGMYPDLPKQAGEALRKLQQKQYRPWILQQAAQTHPDSAHLLVSLTPKAPPDDIRNPLPVTPSLLNTHDALAMIGGDGASDDPVVGSKPVNTLQAAIDVAFGSYHLYGSLATLPGEDPAALIKPDPNAKTMIGIQFPLLSNLGLSGFVELHRLRTGDPGNANITTAAMGGIGVSW